MMLRMTIISTIKRYTRQQAGQQVINNLPFPVFIIKCPIQIHVQFLQVDIGRPMSER